MALSELQRTLRHNVIRQLHLLSSPEEQLDYQRNVPIANVVAELFCGWDECVPEEWRNDPDFRVVFSDQEITEILRFHRVFENVSRMMDKLQYMPIEDFIQTPEWKTLSDAAKQVTLNQQTLNPPTHPS